LAAVEYCGEDGRSGSVEAVYGGFPVGFAVGFGDPIFEID
jgi:hypothetical protein